MLDQTVDTRPSWLTVLWPGAQATPAWLGSGVERFIAVPSAAAPTQLLPWTLGSCRAAAHRRSDFRSSARTAVDGVGVLGLLAMAPFRRGSRLSLRTDHGAGLVAHLREQVDPTIRSAVVLCGPVRANQKPVLQLIDRWGRTVAFVKVAWNQLTAELLHAEQTALQHLASVPDRGFTVPQVIGTGEYAGGSWLAITPAGVRRRLPAQRQATFDLARAIERTGDQWSGTTAGSPFVGQLQAASADLPRSGAIVHDLVQRHGTRPLLLSPSHGDFVPWNILSGVPAFAVWDWERYDLLRPVGFDRLHYAFQIEVASRARPIAEGTATILSSLADIVPELDPATATLHFHWYLADVMCRYERDGARTGVAATTTRAAEIADVFDMPGRTQ